jgi:two-component system cell cycle response regulator
LARERKKLFTVATTDGLTGVCNVRYFRDVMGHILTPPDRSMNYLRDKHICLIMSDIDKFKLFNDTYGHQTGDAVLKSFAGILKTSVRGIDIVARYGGEEFVVVLFDATLKNAAKVTENIRAAVETSITRYEGKDYKMTASFGISEYKKDKDDLESLIKRADEALYRSKKAGRNRVSLEP